MTVREWAEHWQEKYDAPAVRRTSYEAHRYVLGNHIIPSLGEWELTELTAGMVGEFLAERRAHGNRRTGGSLSEVTMGHIWRLLTCILNRAVEEGQLTENPARAFQYPTVRQVKVETLADQEVEDYLDAAGELGYLPIFLLSTPVRFCSFSPNRKCRKMAGKCVRPLNNYTCRFRPSSLKQADKSGLDGLQAGK